MLWSRRAADLPQGMMTSACFRLGATKVSKAGFTNFVYCSITPSMSLPRIATSLCILHIKVLQTQPQCDMILHNVSACLHKIGGLIGPDAVRGLEQAKAGADMLAEDVAAL